MNVSSDNSFNNQCIDLLNDCVRARDNDQRAELRIFRIDKTLHVRCITVSKIRIIWDGFLHSIGKRKMLKYGECSWSKPDHITVIRKFIEIAPQFLTNETSTHTQKIGLIKELINLFKANSKLTQHDIEDIKNIPRMMKLSPMIADNLRLIEPSANRPNPTRSILKRPTDPNPTRQTVRFHEQNSSYETPTYYRGKKRA